jgi:integrase/recombinase XerD
MLLTNALAAFLLDREAQNLAPRTLKTYRRRLGHFADWCNGQGLTTLDAISTTHFRTYQATLTRELADITARNHAVDCKTFFNFCVGEGWLTVSPANRVKLPRVVERLPVILSPGQIRRVYLACESDRERAALLVLLDTGCRASEFCSLNVGSIDGETVTIRDGKPRRDRRCFLSERTQRALRLYMRSEGIQRGHLWRSERGNHRLTVSGLAQLLYRIGDRVDVHITPHMIRRTCITTLLRSGVDVFTLMKLSGHRDIESLKPYIMLADEDAQQAHRSNSPVDRIFD